MATGRTCERARTSNPRTFSGKPSWYATQLGYPTWCDHWNKRPVKQQLKVVVVVVVVVVVIIVVVLVAVVVVAAVAVAAAVVVAVAAVAVPICGSSIVV